MYGIQHRAFWVFQVAETHEKGRQKGQRKEIRVYFNVTVGPPDRPSNVQKWMQKWRGRPYTEQELIEDGIDPEKVVGSACQLDITHEINRKGELRAKVDSIRPAGDTKLEPLNYKAVAQRRRLAGTESVNAVQDQVPW